MIIGVVMAVMVIAVMVIICRSRRWRECAQQQTYPYGATDQKPLHRISSLVK
jgi:hypothetical protein